MLERYSGGLGAFDNEQRDHGNLRRFPSRPPRKNHSTTGPRSGPLKLNLNTTKCFLNWFSHLLRRRLLKPAAILLSVVCARLQVYTGKPFYGHVAVSERARNASRCWDGQILPLTTGRVRNYLWLSWSTLAVAGLTGSVFSPSQTQNNWTRIGQSRSRPAKTNKKFNDD